MVGIYGIINLQRYKIINDDKCIIRLMVERLEDNICFMSYFNVEK